jgi:oxygen-independent coproporphyrinogen-3 oxidase
MTESMEAKGQSSSAPCRSQAKTKSPQEKCAAYVHIPWCKRRCPYCDFYFEIGKPDSSFVHALKTEIDARVHEVDSVPFSSLYLGGGTPTALSPDAIAMIIETVHRAKGLVAGAEITVEANPEDLTAAMCEQLALAGVNRISLGVQSFAPEALRFLGRAHSADQAQEAIAFAACIPKISVDLIGGLPDEKPHRVKHDIEILAGLGVGHVSAYLLTVEQGTPLFERIQKGRCHDVDLDAQADVYESMREEFFRLGYQQYEISSYAQENHESDHNPVYWSQGMYVGFGPGAHSMRLLPDGSVIRRHNVPSLAKWLADPGGDVFEEERLPSKVAMGEAMAFGLRDLKRGIFPEELAERHQIEISSAQQGVLARFVAQGWLVSKNGQYRFTKQGALFADAVARDLL